MRIVISIICLLEFLGMPEVLCNPYGDGSLLFRLLESVQNPRIPMDA